MSKQEYKMKVLGIGNYRVRFALSRGKSIASPNYNLLRLFSR